FALLWWWVTPALVRAKARIDRALLGRARTEELAERVQQVTESRAESVDFSAAELRRIERDLHDGAQARLVALGMSLGMADDLLAGDPDAARRLLVEARSTTTAALSDLRSVVRGIHPPVLADRGLAGAVEALAISLPIPVTITVDMDGRAPAPIESAAYFAVAECLANAGKHSAATQVWVSIGHRDSRLQLVVVDDGIGGAAMDKGSGLAGVARRLAVFDGTMDLSSPAGGPTSVSMEVPCELSSPKTSPSSGTG
ncbi:MAG: sensor histidine kinase, partial [Propionibacteriales bacterium]|nr:sensor histidine kinase [Propionibacteriales bacterium]